MLVSQKRRNFASVNELRRHIELLLLQNDCVIVPDFGGFMAHPVCAHYDEEDRTYLPPTRTLGFNPQLRMNDSLLVQSYAETYDISYPEALRRIEDEVSQLRQQLDEKGSYTLEGLGELQINAEGNYEFQPCTAGILTPEYYGLDAFTFRKLGDMVPLAEQTAEAEPTSDNSTDTTLSDTGQAPALLDFTDGGDDYERAISIKMSWIRNAVAIAAAIVAFFFIATPVANSDLDAVSLSDIKSNIFYRLLPQDTNVVPVQPVEEKTNQPLAKEQENTVSSVPETTSPSKEAVTSKEEKKEPKVSYTIVLASQVKKSNAELYVEQLQKAGYEGARVYINNNIVRVVYGEFKTQAEAYKELNSLHRKQGFEEAWVYKKAEV